MHHGNASSASTTRGILSGVMRQTPASNTNTIDFITIMTTGNATDFGDLTAIGFQMQIRSN